MNKTGKMLRGIVMSTALMLSAVSAQAATFVIVNGDSAGEGFNDPTAAMPVGGNNGTTLGQQRMNAFAAAANIWATRLQSNVQIRVNAQFNNLACSQNAGTLGSAGTNFVHRNFSGAPVANTWYPDALADARSGTDQSAGNADINATFSSNLGTPGCLENGGWYFGLDGNTPNNKFDFVTVLIHELGHGLGFATYVDLASGAKFNGSDDAFMRNLEYHGNMPADYPSMSDAQRLAASKSNGNLHWIGANARAAGSVLTAGRVGDHIRMYAPATQKPGSSVSHWDDVLTPNQVMEWNYTQSLHNPVLDLAALKDIGWVTISGAASTATSLMSSDTSTVYGQSVTFTATVTSGGGTPTGTVTFKDGATAIGSKTLASGSAILAVSTLTAGTHNMTAVFNANASFGTSTSGTVQQVVAKENTTLALAAAPASAFVGKPIAFVATLTGDGGPVPGSVNFKNGATVIGTGAINANNKASFTTSSLGVGGHVITGVYPNTSNTNGSQGTATVFVSGATLNGAETRANTRTADAQVTPAIAKLTNGGFVTVWSSSVQDGSGFGIYGQRYDQNGAKVGTEFAINTITAGDQVTPKVAGLTDGGFAVVWGSDGGGAVSWDVYARRYTSAGVAGTAFRVNKTTAGIQQHPAVAPLANASFAVVWEGVDAAGTGIFSQVFNSASAALTGTDFLVNTYTPNNQSFPAVAQVPAGGFIVTWQSDMQDGSGLGVYMQRMSAANAKSGMEVKVNTTTANNQMMPAVAGLTNGYVIVWSSQIQDGSGLGIFGQRFDGSNVAQGAEFLVNTYRTSDQFEPSVAGYGTGGWVVSWSSQQDGDGTGIYGQAFKADGTKADVEFRFNTEYHGKQRQPAVAAFNDGLTVGVWNSESQDGGGGGIYFQRLTIPGTH
jgi:hypothetical protein